MALPVSRRSLLALPAVLFGIAAAAQTAPFLSGRVTWSSGVPAQGLAVQLRRGGETVASTFSDSTGYFAFHGVPGQPREYTLDIVASGGVIATVTVGDLPAGSALPAIILQ